MNNSTQRSGRTTRILLKAAIKISESPEKQVLLFAWSMDYAKILCRRLYVLCRHCEIPITQKQIIPKSYQLDSKTIKWDDKILVEDHYIKLMR